MTDTQEVPDTKAGMQSAFIAVTTLFFAWGFITAMIDPLVPTVKAIFHLTMTQSLLTTFAFFMAYGVVSLPGAAMVAKLGYARAIVYALLAMLLGCLCIPLATYVEHYELVLVALFIIASGITVLQVAANPLAAALGDPSRSHFRLTFSQAFNSLGTVIAPYLGSALMLHGGVFSTSAGSVEAAAVRNESLRNIDTSFLLIAVMIAVLVIFIWRFSSRLGRAAAPPAPAHDSVLHALRSGWAVLGAAGIFLYVGAEVSIGSSMSNFLHQPDILDVPLEMAGKLVSYYWLGAMVGRFAGSALLTRIRASMLLSIAAAIAAILCLTVSQSVGPTAASCAIAIGLVNSIMFPTIFTLTLERSSASAAATSGLLCVAIVGGAILPPITGHIVDTVGQHASLSVGFRTAYLLPMAAYVAICLFGLAAVKARVTGMGRTAGSPAH